VVVWDGGQRCAPGALAGRGDDELVFGLLGGAGPRPGGRPDGLGSPDAAAVSAPPDGGRSAPEPPGGWLLHAGLRGHCVWEGGVDDGGPAPGDGGGALLRLPAAVSGEASLGLGHRGVMAGDAGGGLGEGASGGLLPKVGDGERDHPGGSSPERAGRPLGGPEPGASAAGAPGGVDGGPALSASPAKKTREGCVPILSGLAPL
jgi:hypothetical protein